MQKFYPPRSSSRRGSLFEHLRQFAGEIPEGSVKVFVAESVTMSSTDQRRAEFRGRR